MEKKKAILKIESYSSKDGMLLLSVSDYGVRAMLKGLVDLCNKNYGGYIKLDMSPPYKARTTGLGSQNSKIWALIQQIAEATGNELQDVEDALKERAMKRGYPYSMNQLTGRPRPLSMTLIDTKEASILIDELHQLAAELGINLVEE